LGVVGGGCGYPSAWDTRGAAASEILRLTWLMIGLGGAVFVFVMVVLYRSLTRPDHRAVPRWASGHRLLVGGGIVLPTLVITPLVVLTLTTMDSLGRAEPGALEVRVVGHQFWWQVEYPGLGVAAANEIHLPVGRDVRIELSSDNVIHSFWVPTLGHKLDTTPGRVNELVWRADEPGIYQGYCGEYCGVQHAKMRFRAVALEPDEFDRWVTDRRAAVEARAAAEAPEGFQVFVDAGCAVCHAIGGTPAGGVVGPDLTHMGIRQTIGAGIVRNDPEQMRRWITDPNDLKPGVLMPAFGDRLGAEEIDELVRYLDGLD
jgi:cytochrome c oxidase subunit II